MHGSTKLNLPREEYSIAGNSKLHTDAATITPEAKPESIDDILSSSFLKDTNAAKAPKVVPKRGIKAPDKTLKSKEITPVVILCGSDYYVTF